MQFIDLQAQRARLRDAIDAGLADVLDSGAFILGPQVAALEAGLADFAGARHAIGCANGTDAIILALAALGVGEGDAVFVPSFTYCATAEAVVQRRAVPVFVDVDRDTYNMDPASLSDAIAAVRAEGKLDAACVMAVDLFGQCADYPAIKAVAEGLPLISDSAQGFGSTRGGHHPLHWADVQTTSFYPAKPLGCYGDGGAVMTNSDAHDALLRSLRFHGRADVAYDHARIGMNSRLDTMQAAVLLPKLGIFADEIEARNRVAARYTRALGNVVGRVPTVDGGVVSTWAQYTIEVDDPDALQAGLRERDIPSARYYPLPTHVQTAYAAYPRAPGGLPNTDAAAERVISLPMHPYLSEADQDRVVEAIRELV